MYTKTKTKKLLNNMVGSLNYNREKYIKSLSQLIFRDIGVQLVETFMRIHGLIFVNKFL